MKWSEVAKSYPTHWDPMDCSLPDSSVHGISRQEYWSGLPIHSPGSLPDPGIKPRSPASPALVHGFFTAEPTHMCIYIYIYVYIYIYTIPHYVCMGIYIYTYICIYAAAAAKSLQSCPTLWDPIEVLLCPWDSPGKNTGVGCHFLLQCMKVKNESEVAQACPTLCDPMDCSLPGSSVHGIF